MEATAFSTIFAAFLCLLRSFHSVATAAYTPKASGTVTCGNSKAIIDASYASEGYLMTRYTGSNPTIRLRIAKDTMYAYILDSSGQYETFPLTESSGTYNVKVFGLVSGTQYVQVVSESAPVTPSSDTKPFLYPSQFCNLNASSAVVPQTDTITFGISESSDRVTAIYNYTVDIITYDNEKAKAVQSDYLPNPDITLSQKSDIYFNYVPLMTSMLHSQNIPTKLVVSYADDVYHAQVSICIQSQGWIDNVICFNGTSWKFMDPTLVSGGKKSQEALDYASSLAYYTVRFIY